MKSKKFIAGVMAVAMVFGSAVALPANNFIKGSVISASAGGGWWDYETDDYGYSINDDNTIKIQYWGEDKETVEIPSEVDGKTVTEIGGLGIFYTATEIVIPESVTAISDWAFNGCYNLNSITIPKTVTNIGNEGIGYLFDRDTFENHKNDDFTIYCYEGSAGEQYAIDNGFDYVTISEPVNENLPYLYGLTYNESKEKLAEKNEVFYEYYNETVDANSGNTIIELYQQCPDFTPNGNPIMLNEGFLYGLTKDGSAIIYGYVGDNTDISLPEEINGAKVTTVQYAYMSESYEFDKDGNQVCSGGGIQPKFITKSDDTKLNIIIPTTVTELATVCSQDNLTLFCEEGSPAAQTLTTNGVAFTKYDKNSSESESSENSQNDTNTSSKSETTSNSNKTNNSSTANPSTGAAAGLALAAVGLGAVVVTKRRK